MIADTRMGSEAIHKIATVEHEKIPMTDGVVLSARIWRPECEGRFPAILEYIPYRKRDMVRARDERNHPYFASQGFVCLRVDMRGSGDSEGAMRDMYCEEELSDARQVIEWIAGQHWCDGSVGMFGTSWGGTSSLQAAIDSPLPLKAVIANCSTGNRFEDDIHWMGGCLLTDSFEWGATLPAILAAPPDSTTVGPDWMAQWQRRLAQLEFPLDQWISHKTKNDYWKRGSVSLCAERLNVPVLAVGGWSDRYSNSVVDLVSRRPDICWGIIGPWGHHYPDVGNPGPSIGFQEVALQWWNCWLKPSGKRPIWPRIRLWRREFDKPQIQISARSGAWVQYDYPAAFSETTYFLTKFGLKSKPDLTGSFVKVPNEISHGRCSGDTGYFGRPNDLPPDQAEDDKRCLCFDSETLGRELDFIGNVEMSVEVVRDRQDAQLACRLCEVSSDGQSNLVSRQVLNLALDESREGTAVFKPRQRQRYTVRFPAMAYKFSKGNRIRLAIGTSYWPLVWPSPVHSDIRLAVGKAELRFPMIGETHALAQEFPEAGTHPPDPAWETISGEVLRDFYAEDRGERILEGWRLPPTATRYPEIGVKVGAATTVRYHADKLEKAKAGFSINYRLEIERPDGDAELKSSLTAVQEGRNLSTNAELIVKWRGLRLTRKSWHRRFDIGTS